MTRFTASLPPWTSTATSWIDGSRWVVRHSVEVEPWFDDVFRAARYALHDNPCALLQGTRLSLVSRRDVEASDLAGATYTFLSGRDWLGLEAEDGRFAGRTVAIAASQGGGHSQSSLLASAAITPRGWSYEVPFEELCRCFDEAREAQRRLRKLGSLVGMWD